MPIDRTNNKEVLGSVSGPVLVTPPNAPYDQTTFVAYTGKNRPLLKGTFGPALRVWVKMPFNELSIYETIEVIQTLKKLGFVEARDVKLTDADWKMALKESTFYGALDAVSSNKRGILNDFFKSSSAEQGDYAWSNIAGVIITKSTPDRNFVTRGRITDDRTIKNIIKRDAPGQNQRDGYKPNPAAMLGDQVRISVNWNVPAGAWWKAVMAQASHAPSSIRRLLTPRGPHSTLVDEREADAVWVWAKMFPGWDVQGAHPLKFESHAS
jgi:hypothetical protein